MKKTFTTFLDFGDKVRLKSDENIEGIITKIILEPHGAKTYEVSMGCDKS